MIAKPVVHLLADSGSPNPTVVRTLSSNDNPYSGKPVPHLSRYGRTFPNRFGSFRRRQAHCQRFMTCINEDHVSSRALAITRTADLHTDERSDVRELRGVVRSTPTPNIPSASSTKVPTHRHFQPSRGSINR